HRVRTGIRCRQREFGNRAAGGDAAALVAGLFREPECSVWALDNADRGCIRRRQIELGERICPGIEPADLRGAAFAEPEAAVAALDRDIGLAARGRNPMLANGGWGDSAPAGRGLVCNRHARMLA